MILPKPPTLAGSAGIEALSSPSAASHLTASPPQPRYRFGLTSLAQIDADISNHDLNAVLEQLLDCARLLTVPSLFSHGDGQAWTLSEEHSPTLLQWREQEVSLLLSQVSKLLEQLASRSASTAVPREDERLTELVVGHVLCAVAKYISPTHTQDLGESASAELDDGWISKSAQSQARSSLDKLPQVLASSALPGPSSLAEGLLVDYIKPIFREVASSSSASTSAFDPDTGRRKAPAAGSTFVSHLDAHLGQHRFQSAAEDSDASNLAPKRFQLSLPSETVKSGATSSHATTLSDDAISSLIERNEALGCINVLAWCLDSLQLRTESEWTSVWPLLVPPLITLLEHTQPRFRVRGAQLVQRLLARPSEQDSQGNSDVRSRQVVLGKLLIRTGIGSLLERALHVNLTYVHDENYAPALLSHSIGALRQLILLTTHPIAYRGPDQHQLESPSLRPSQDIAGTALDHPDDCGKGRMETLFTLLSEGVLSTWSYLPLPPSSTRLGRELVNVTCSAYMVLAADLAAPALPDGEASIGGMARFLDVSIDWIFRSWVSNVAFDHTDQIPATIQVLGLASRLLFPAESFSTQGSGQSSSNTSTSCRFTGMILVSIAKCWVSAQGSHLRGSSQSRGDTGARWEALQDSLASLLAQLAAIDSSVDSRWAELVKLDGRLALLLPSAHEASCSTD